MGIGKRISIEAFLREGGVLSAALWPPHGVLPLLQRMLPELRRTLVDSSVIADRDVDEKRPPLPSLPGPSQHRHRMGKGAPGQTGRAPHVP